jgi:hypothetical protein
MQRATRRISATWLAAAAMGVPSFALAEDTFRGEAGLSYSRFSAEGVRENTARAEAAYFFDQLPVSPKDHPLDQAAFVGRIGSVSANYGRSDRDVDGYQTLDRGSMYGASIDFRRTDMPLIVRAGYDSSYSGKTGGPVPSSTATFESQIDSRHYQLSLGGYVARTTALSLDWSKSKDRFKVTQSDGAVLPEVNDSFTSTGISGQHLSQVSKDTYVATVARVGRTKSEPQGAPSAKNLEWYLEATYYPLKTLGVALGVLSSRGDDASSEGETYLARIRMFVTPIVSLSLDFQQNHTKAPSSLDTDYVSLTARVRF